MQNAVLARQFELLADYLELAGDSIFKIRAYQSAAQAIADLPVPVELAAQNGALKEMEGLGPATIAKTREFLKTGKIKLLEKLETDYPPGLLQVLRVPGLGPKKVLLLWKEKGVDSLESLQNLVETGGLVGVGGFGAKTIENLKTSLRRFNEMGARLALTDAVRLAKRIKNALPELQIHEVGSLRRGCDTLGNLNFLVETRENERALNQIAGLGLWEEVIENNGARLAARMAPAIEVFFDCIAPERIGTQLVFCTGSKAFLEAIPHKNRDSSGDETQFFRLQGVPFIAPELRETAEIWELAREDKLPDLLELSDIRGDLHLHTQWSDGAHSIREMAGAARERGYEFLCITDHSKALAMANGLNAQRLRQQAEEIARVQEDFPDFKIFRGVECDILRDGTMDLDDEILSELDFVIGSVHSAFNLSQSEQTDRVIRAIQNPHVDLIGHPTGRVLGVRPPYDLDIEAVIQACRSTGTILEINASERLDLKDSHVKIAMENGVHLAINTDAHSVSMLAHLHFGVLVARRGWCQTKNVINCLSRAELESLLKKEKSHRFQ